MVLVKRFNKSRREEILDGQVILHFHNHPFVRASVVSLELRPIRLPKEVG